MARWSYGQGARWPDGQVARWSDGQVVRWSGGQVVRWSGGQVVRWSGVQVRIGSSELRPGHHAEPWVELDICDWALVLPLQLPCTAAVLRPPEVQQPVSRARDHELRVWGEGGLDGQTLVILVTCQCEQGLPLEGVYHPDNCPIGGEHHELAVQAELDAGPVAALLYGILEGGEGALVEAPDVVELDLFALHPHREDQPLGVEAGHGPALALHESQAVRSPEVPQPRRPVEAAGQDGVVHRTHGQAHHLGGTGEG